MEQIHNHDLLYSVFEFWEVVFGILELLFIELTWLTAIPNKAKTYSIQNTCWVHLSSFMTLGRWILSVSHFIEISYCVYANCRSIWLLVVIFQELLNIVIDLHNFK